MKNKNLEVSESGGSERTSRVAGSPIRGSPNGRSPMRSSKPTTTASRKSSNPNSTAAAGRTPQTRRKNLSIPPNGTSSSPAPRKTNPPTKRPKQPEHPVRKQSTTDNPSKSLRLEKPRPRSHRRPSPPIQTEAPKVEVPEERQKFDELWNLKTIENGMVRVPTHMLQDLIHKENIEKFYALDPKPVASGLFATVRKCTHRESGIQYAAKYSSRIRCGVDCSMEILHEIAMLSVCTESNRIVHLKDVFQNKHEIILVLEYAPGGDFQSVLDEDMVPFEQDVQGFLCQTLEALEFIHERNIAHLDIKPQNIVLMGQFPNCEIKLCDLEVARVIQAGEDIQEIIGTPDYVAPEILALEPITLSADIWSLGVLAYVLLTGFSPFGGDTDQETLRNISVGTVDFPPELFEGVSDQAKDFIAQCLIRDPKKRLTVRECLKHPWLAQEEEPPSPSPLMLKIPTPDHFTSPKLSVHSPTTPHSPTHNPSHGSGSSRRSCQTCRDKNTERKRYLSKSREAIFEKVAQSNLKKSLSKSRERLCDMRLTLSKSRDHLNDSFKNLSRSQDKFYGFKCLSKSQEVLSSALGGAMKRMVNGAVSDIPRMIIPNQPAILDPTSPDSGMDFVLLPGSSVLMSHSDLASLSKVNSGSLQLLPISESGRSTPASICSVSTVHDVQCSDSLPTAQLIPIPTVEAHHEPLFEVSEEDEASSKSEDEKDVKEMSVQTITDKDEKDSFNYERKQSMSKSVDDSEILNDKQPLKQASIGIQVNMTKSCSSPNLARKALMSLELEQTSVAENKKNTSSPTLNKPFESEIIRRKGGFTHSDTMGEEKRKYTWREELDKFRLQSKPLRVAELIGTFSRKKETTEHNNNEVDELKAKRRGSLQINFDPLAVQNEDEVVKERNALKVQRRKSTSAIPPLKISEIKMHEIAAEMVNRKFQEEEEDEEKTDDKPEKEEKSLKEQESTEETSSSKEEKTSLGKAYLEKVNERKKNWDYFEINHPKAISDKKLQQLKAKYQRRRTENCLGGAANNTIKEEEETDTSKAEQKKPPLRANTVPVGLGADKEKGGDLELSIDPFTGQCLDQQTRSKSDDQETAADDLADIKLRKVSSDSGEDTGSSRRSSRSSRRRSSHLTDIQEQSIPEETVLEVRIDPFTGHMETVEVPKKKSSLSVDIPAAAHEDDAGIGSLPNTPTDVGGLERRLMPLDDGIFTSSEEVLPSEGSTTWESDQSEAIDLNSAANQRPGRGRSLSIQSDATLMRMCTGAYSRALEKYTQQANNEEKQNSLNKAEDQNSLNRRQSSPTLRPT